MTLYIHLFGHLRLFIDGQPANFNALPKTHHLLAYLLLHRHAPVPRDTIAYLLWDDVPENESRANLRRHLHDLRRALPPAPQSSPWIVSINKALQWNAAAPYWLDVAAFEQTSQTIDRLAEAVTHYTGDLLQDLYDDWLVPFREQLQAQYLAALTRLIQRQQEHSDIDQAIVYAKLLLQVDPAREDIIRILMRMHVAQGDRASAIQAYRRFAERLYEDLGVEPMAETADFYNSIVQNQPLPQTTTSVPLPSRPPFASPPHNLPAALTRFIGRETELATISQLLGSAETATRLLTITGPGGSGKTRLALEAAHYLRQHNAELFPDGLFFVRLADLQEPEQVLTAVINSLNLAETTHLQPAISLLNHLQSRKMLLVLDNFEHLLPAAATATEWLTAAPSLRLLVTSQARLNVYGEQELPLAPLPLPGVTTSRSAATLSIYPAIALFVDRARATRPDFSLDDSNAEAIADICISLDGMPLALELAAARSKFFSPTAIRDQLQQRLHFLTGQMRDLVARQQTLRATIDWSYNLLSAEEKVVFQYVSVFNGNFTLEAAEAVAGTAVSPPTPYFDVLVALVERNMVRQSHGHDPPQFRLLQTLREYGQEKLAEQETAESIRHRHAHYYLELAEQIAQLSTVNQLDSFASIHDNLRTALSWAAGRNNNDFGLSLCAALANFWENRGYIHEGRRWLKQFLEMPGNLQPVHKAAGLLAAGILALRQAEFATALTYYKESLAIWQTLDEPKQMARTLLYLGILARRDAKEDKSRDLFDQSLAIYRQIGEQNGIATVLKNLGNVSLDDGDLLSARSLYEECLTIERSLGNLDKIASVLNNLGLVAYGLGDVAASQQLHTEALAIRRQLAIKPGIGQSLNNLGRVLLHQKEYASSDQVQHEALSLFTELGYKISIVELIESLGLLAAFQGKPAQTARFLAFALKWREQLYSERDPIYEDVYQQAVTLAQSQMESAMWQMAWIEGEIMAWDTAVSQAHQSKT